MITHPIMKAAVLVLSLTMCAALAPGALDAQAAPAPFAEARVGRTIRVQLHDGGRIEGRVTAADGARVRLDGVPAPVEATQVDSLWLRRSGTGRGAVIGAAGGALAGLGFAVFVCDRVSEGQGCDAWDAVALITAGGAAGGALIGAAVGSAMPRWTRAYARTAPVLGARDGRWRVGMRVGL